MRILRCAAVLLSCCCFQVLAQTPIVVVSDFDDRSRKGLNLGHKVREEITDILVQLPHVQIVERMRMDKIIEEMNFSQSAYVDASTAAEFGKKAGASLVIFGSVANASYSAQQRDSFSLTEGKTKVKRGVSKVNINVQVVDVETNETIFSKSVQGSATGDATEAAVIPLAVSDAVENIAPDLEGQFPIKGYVIKKERQDKAYVVYLDAGANFGLEAGREVLIYGEGETLVHPVTNEILSSSKGKLLGKAKVLEVSEKYSTATMRKNDFRKVEIAMTFEIAPRKKNDSVKAVKGLLDTLGFN